MTCAEGLIDFFFESIGRAAFSEVGLFPSIDCLVESLDFLINLESVSLLFYLELASLLLLRTRRLLLKVDWAETLTPPTSLVTTI